MNALSFIFLAIFGTSEGKRSSISAMVSQRLGLPKTKMRVLIFALYHVLQIKEQILNLQILKKNQEISSLFSSAPNGFLFENKNRPKSLDVRAATANFWQTRPSHQWTLSILRNPEKA